MESRENLLKELYLRERLVDCLAELDWDAVIPSQELQNLDAQLTLQRTSNLKRRITSISNLPLLPRPPRVKRLRVDLELKGYQWILYQSKLESDPLSSVLPLAHKSLTTQDWLALREENRQSKMLKRVQSLKEKDAWSFRQLKRLPEPPRLKTHWDYLLDEMVLF